MCTITAACVSSLGDGGVGGERDPTGVSSSALLPEAGNNPDVTLQSPVVDHSLHPTGVRNCRSAFCNRADVELSKYGSAMALALEVLLRYVYLN